MMVCEITIVLRGLSNDVYNASRGVFDACAVMPTDLFKHIDFDYFEVKV